MRLLGVELRRVDLTMRRAVGTSAGTHVRRPVAYVRVACEGVDGWGECGALPAGTAVDPPLAAVWEALRGPGVARLLRAAAARRGDLPDAAQVARMFDTTPVGRMVAAVLEMAVLDAELRAGGMPLAARLGTGDPVPAGAVLGIPEDRDPVGLADAAAGLAARGFRRLRLKIEPGWDVVPVRAVRAALPGVALQVDANGAYRRRRGPSGAAAPPAADADRLVELDAFGLACIEQPLPPADLPALADVAGRLGTPVCLDESLTSLRRLTDAVRYGACEVACLKPARLGGLLAARQAHDACLAAGIPAFVGGFFDTGLARSAHAALAGLRGFTLAGDLADPADYLDADPCGYGPVVDGLVRPPAAPGVGPPPAPDALAAGDADVAWFPRGA